MARITNRNFLPGFQALEIEYGPDQRGPDVSDDIQMTYNMGQAAPPVIDVQIFTPGWDAPDPIPPSYQVSLIVGGVAGQTGRIHLRASAGGGGLWVLGISTDAGGFVPVEIWTLAAFEGLISTLNPTALNSCAFGDGSDATATIEFGRSAVAKPANVARYEMAQGSINKIADSVGWPIYIAPTRVFVMATANTGTTRRFQVAWREVP